MTPLFQLPKKRILLATMMGAAILAAGCVPEADAPQPLPQPGVSIQRYTPLPTPTMTPTLTLTPTFNPLMTLTPTLPPSPTPDVYSDWYIDNLAAGTYGGGVLEDLGALRASSTKFGRRLFRYRSDGLDLFGFINLPDGDGPFPVIFMFHGYIEPKDYTTLDYSTRYADALAEEGYIVVHPNLRGYAPSPAAENSLGIGDTVDALNLIALVRRQAGTEGLLKKADAEKIALWGHSMGGGIVMRILVVDDEIDAALLYASIHANEEFNLAHFDEDGRGYKKTDAPAAALAKISPLAYLDRVSAPVSIHQGSRDAVVPPEWSDFLCEYLKERNKQVECLTYSDQAHTFQNNGDVNFINNSTRFFNEFLKNNPD